jgi:hypothetical protein
MRPILKADRETCAIEKPIARQRCVKRYKTQQTAGVEES